MVESVYSRVEEDYITEAVQSIYMCLQSHDVNAEALPAVASDVYSANIFMTTQLAMDTVSQTKLQTDCTLWFEL